MDAFAKATAFVKAMLVQAANAAARTKNSYLSSCSGTPARRRSPGGIDQLYVHCPDHLARSYAHQVLLLEEFLRAGEEKCGSVCIGGEPLTSLPQGQPSWLLLTLDAQGEWHVNWPAFDTYLQGARQQIAQAPSLIAQIETYNVHLEYLVKALALRADLGQTHRHESTLAMERMARTFFEDGRGADQRMIAMLRTTIHVRFLGKHSTIHLPEAWLCWPLTAGRCGLIQATILSASYQATYAQRAHVAPPEERGPDWQSRRNAWASFYRSLTTEIQAGEPAANKVMETLVTDFIHRGSEMTNRHQAGLSPYWRWILSIYGPQMLDLLGTFRFLITELVPLQLIIQKYRQGAMGEEGDV